MPVQPVVGPMGRSRSQVGVARHEKEPIENARAESMASGHAGERYRECSGSWAGRAPEPTAHQVPAPFASHPMLQCNIGAGGAFRC